ncbi:hypothetical protein MVES1_002746 [Malassezia vespertilionis]|uniref:Uncharacterized protein n=1 Tax=Malassezia vespertilionis TaxID=2020962 RepID=A0A2N1JAR4_9BASI|nr:uncharacterized protein MVES1_002746 [Malassezia vespertilionis]PKI83644.1 hypothetical protein MVES_002593 [Malassezia vespertilionis]WFD07382.1 hypothetical protein MVES1_002746 [Malassezia vespertilionis]
MGWCAFARCEDTAQDATVVALRDYIESDGAGGEIQEQVAFAEKMVRVLRKALPLHGSAYESVLGDALRLMSRELATSAVWAQSDVFVALSAFAFEQRIENAARDSYFRAIHNTLFYCTDVRDAWFAQFRSSLLDALEDEAVVATLCVDSALEAQFRVLVRIMLIGVQCTNFHTLKKEVHERLVTASFAIIERLKMPDETPPGSWIPSDTFSTAMALVLHSMDEQHPDNRAMLPLLYDVLVALKEEECELSMTMQHALGLIVFIGTQWPRGKARLPAVERIAEMLVRLLDRCIDVTTGDLNACTKQTSSDFVAMQTSAWLFLAGVCSSSLDLCCAVERHFYVHKDVQATRDPPLQPRVRALEICMSSETLITLEAYIGYVLFLTSKKNPSLFLQRFSWERCMGVLYMENIEHTVGATDAELSRKHVHPYNKHAPTDLASAQLLEALLTVKKCGTIVMENPVEAAHRQGVLADVEAQMEAAERKEARDEEVAVQAALDTFARQKSRHLGQGAPTRPEALVKVAPPPNAT